MNRKKFCIFVCGNCGTKLYGPLTQKTKRCVKCDKTVQIKKAKKMGFFETEKEAISALKYLKIPKSIRDQSFKEINDAVLETPRKDSKLRLFKNMLQKISTSNEDELISINKILEEAEQIGLDEEQTMNMLHELVNIGELFQPKMGLYKFI